MNVQPTPEEMQEAIQKDIARHKENIRNHLNTIQKEMEGISIKILTQPVLKAGTIIHEMKRYLELQTAAAYVGQIGQWAHPEQPPVETTGETIPEEGKVISMQTPESLQPLPIDELVSEPNLPL
jgi:hypothetical protein